MLVSRGPNIQGGLYSGDFTVYSLIINTCLRVFVFEGVMILASIHIRKVKINSTIRYQEGFINIFETFSVIEKSVMQ